MVCVRKWEASKAECWKKTQTNQKKLGVNSDGIFMCATSRHATSAVATSSWRPAHAYVHTNTS